MVKSLETEQTIKPPIALVRGVGDVGSAVAWKLFHAGFIVICHENRQPRTIRRRMAFCDAVWTGDAVLDGLQAVRVERLHDVLSVAKGRDGIAVYTGPFDALVDNLNPQLIIDARIQKFGQATPIKGLADVTIGIGPNFVADEDVHLVVESCFGDRLGSLIFEGSAEAPVPQPPKLDGVGWERFIRADAAGRFETDKDIGLYVEEGQVIGTLSGAPVVAPLSGFLRGLLHTGLSVLKGEKLAEIDPRGDRAHYIGLAERPARIADGVLEGVAVLSRKKKLNHFMNQGVLAVHEKDSKRS